MTTSRITTSKIFYSLIESQLLHCISTCHWRYHALFCTTNSMKFSFHEDWPCVFISLSNTDIPRNAWGHSPEFLAAFPGIFGNIPLNMWGHSLECLTTFPRMFGYIPGNVWRHSRECLATFPKCLATFSGMSDNIPRVPRIVFPIPEFLVLYIAL